MTGQALTYTEIYPYPPKRSLTLPSAPGFAFNYVEAPAAVMPEATYGEHHLLIHLHEHAQHMTQARDGRTHELHLLTGEAVVTPAGMPNAWRWYEQSKCVVVTLRPDFLDDFARREMHVRLDGGQLRESVGRADADLHQLGAMLVGELAVPAPGDDLLKSSLANAFLVRLLRAHGEIRAEEPARLPGGLSSRQYRRALDYIYEHYEQDVKLRELAAEAGVSQYHFTRLFRRATGQTPHQFLISYRVERAKKLLSETDLSIAEAALRLGFADQSHFTRVFRERTGATPKEFRRR